MRRIFVTTASLVIFHFLSGQTTHYYPYDDFDHQINKLLEREKIREASAYLDSLLSVEPACYPCFWHKAKIANYYGNTKEALSLLNKLLTYDSVHYKLDAYIMQGELLDHIGKPKQAIEAIDQALQIEPTNGYLLARKGWILYQELKDKRGKELIHRGYQFNAEHPYCRMVYLHLLFDEGNYELFTNQAKPLLAYPQIELIVTSLLAQSHMYLKNYDTAIFYFEKVKTFEGVLVDEANEMIQMITEQQQYEKSNRNNSKTPAKHEPVNRTSENYAQSEKALRIHDMYYSKLLDPGSGVSDRYLLTLSVDYLIETHATAFQLVLGNTRTMDMENANLTSLVRLKYKQIGLMLISKGNTTTSSIIEFVVSHEEMELIRQYGIKVIIAYMDHPMKLTRHQLKKPDRLEWRLHP